MERKNSSFTIFAMITATLFAKALGMVRGMAMAWMLGDSAEAVAFAAASKIPGAIFDILFSAAILGCFIPAYNKAREESEGAAYGYSCAFFGTVIAVCTLISALGVILAPQIIAVTAPKISPDAAALSASLLRIIFPMMIFTAGAYTLTGILQSIGKFILPAAISAVSNIFIIAYLLVSRDGFSVYTLAWVYVISWFLQFLTLAIPLTARKMMPLPKPDFKNPYIKSSVGAAPQIIAGSLLAPASVLIAAFFSSFVSDATFVAYDYASGIFIIVSGIAVYGVGNYVFPSLSRLFARDDAEGFQKALYRALLSIMMIVIPVFCAVFTLSYEGVALLYLRGSFSEELAVTCGKALCLLSAAMPACAVSEILYRAFYASGKAHIPMYASLCAVASSVICNIAFLSSGGGLYGIALSYTAAQWIYAAFLLISAKRNFPGFWCKTEAFRMAKLCFCGTICFAAMQIIREFVPKFEFSTQSFELLLKITIVFVPATVIYLLCLYTMGFLRPKNKKRGDRS